MTDALEREGELVRAAFPVEFVGKKPGRAKVRLFPSLVVDVDFSAFPKAPKLRIPKNVEKLAGKPKNALQGLLRWDGSRPFHVVAVLEELRNYLENLAGERIRIHSRLVHALCQQARHFHPREFVGLVRVWGGVLYEYLLAPRASSSHDSAIFYQSDVPIDRSIIAVAHSHPSGHAVPSPQDLRSFGRHLFSLIVAFPYRKTDLACFDRTGREIPIELVERTPYDHLWERDGEL
ncbi:MAG: hypothetical protein Kow0069_38870 [Promethearchaeota archaeon]